MPGRTSHHRFTTRAEGDLAIGAVGVAGRRTAVVDLPWTWLVQVHGADVATVTRPGEHAGVAADAAVTAAPGTSVTAASASTPAWSPGRVTVTTAAPWTWRNQVHGRSTTAARRASTPGLSTARSPSSRLVNRDRTGTAGAT